MTAVISSFCLRFTQRHSHQWLRKTQWVNANAKTSHLFSARRKTYRPYLFVRLSSGGACARGMPMCGISLTYRQTQNKALINKKKHNQQQQSNDAKPISALKIRNILFILYVICELRLELIRCKSKYLSPSNSTLSQLLRTCCVYRTKRMQKKFTCFN